MRWLWMMGLGLATTISPPADRTIWLVFSPRSHVDMKRLRGWPKPDRIVLAVENLRSGQLSEEFVQTVAALKEWMGDRFELPVWDPEALDRVRQLGVHRLPALIVFEGAHTHVVEGIPASPQEVLECSH